MTNATNKAPKALAYHKVWLGSTVNGYKVPCVPLDARNVVRGYIMAVTPEGTTLETVEKAVASLDHKALKEADIVLKVRFQRWFKGDTANENDPDGLIPSVGQHGQTLDIPPYLFPMFCAMIEDAQTTFMENVVGITRAAKEAAEANVRKCPACSHKLPGSASKFCPECGHKLPQEAPKEAAKADTWDCTCGHKGNTGKFCGECGSKPAPSEKTEEARPLFKKLPKLPKATDGATTLAELAEAVTATPESLAGAPALANVTALMADPKAVASLAGTLMAMARKMKAKAAR